MTLIPFDEKDAIISALRTENTKLKFKSQSYYNKYLAAENELTATRDELDRIKDIMSPQLRKSIQKFLVDVDNPTNDLGREAYLYNSLQTALNFLRMAVVEDYKIPEDTSWTYTKPIVGIDDEGQPIVIDSWNNKVSRSINNE